MMVSNLLVLLAQTGFVLLFALLIGLSAKKWPSARSAVYRLSIVAAVVLAIGSPWLHERAQPIVPIEWTPSHSFASVAPAAKVAPSPSTSKSIPESTPTSAAVASFDPTRLLPFVWLGIAALLSLRLLIGQLGLSRIRRGCSQVNNPRVTERMPEISFQRGIRCPSVVEGITVNNPFVAGVFRPTIYLPAGWIDGVDDDVLGAVLQHEAAHIANGDLRWNMVYRLSCAVLWPQPLLWLLQSRMSAVNEELCDQQVVAAGIPAPRYAECLLNLRAGIKNTACPALGIGAVSSRSSLGRRVEAILDPRSRRAAISRRVSMSLKVGAILLASCAALLFARPALHAHGNQDAFNGWTVKPYGGVVKVASADGKPLENIKAWLVVVQDEQTARTLEVKDGAAVIPTDVPSGTRATLVVQAKGCGIGFVNLWPAPNPVHRLVLPHSATLTGRFLGPDGSPAGGFGIKIRSVVRRLKGPMMFETFDASTLPGLKFETSAATDGSFQIDGLCPGTTVDFQADDDRYAQLPFTDRAKIDASAAVTHVADVKLRLAARISGRVTQDGKPVAGVKIGAQGQQASDGWGDAVTDSDGRYEIERMGAGAYNVILDERGQPNQKLTATAHEGVSVQPGDVAKDIDFALIPGVLIEGRVTDERSKPVEGAYVGVYGPAHPKSSAWVQSMMTDASGHYQLRVPPGEQYVYIGDSRYKQNSQTLTVKSGTKRIDFQVFPAPPAEASPDDIPAEDAEQIKEPDESVPTPPSLSFGPGAPAYGPIRLAGGGEVTLAYVQDDLAAPHTLWKPDGSQPLQPDVARSLDMHGFSHEGKVRSLFLRVDVAGIERGSYHCLVKVPQVSNWSVWQTYGDQHDNAMDMATFHAAKTLNVTDMKFGIAYEPFRILESGAVGEGPLFARVGSTGTVRVRIPQGIEDKEVLLAAYTATGKRLELHRWDNEDSKDKDGNLTRSYDFNGGSPNNIARVELLVRDYEWVTFKGIQLHPVNHA